MEVRYLQTFSVDSVSKYIEIVETLGIENFIYRGQNEPYYGIQANGFRTYLGGWSSDKIYNIDKLSKDYYQQVITKLTTEEKQYFLAFCQHHGIPTNLIDFSYSPLVALFFSCQGKQEPTFSLSELADKISTETLKNDSATQQMLISNLINRLEKPTLSQYAQVYLLNKKWLLDITDIISELEQSSLIESIYNDGKIRIQLIHKLINLFKNTEITISEISECLIQIIECYRDNNVDFWGGYYSDNDNIDEELENDEMETLFSFSRRLEEENLNDVILDLYYFVFEEMEDERIPYESDIFNHYPDDGGTYRLSAATYILLLANLIQIFHNDRKGADKLELDLKIYFTYQPANLFDRINSQKGLFIYQPYFYSCDSVYNHNVLSTQRITPDIKIEIDNYQTILSELDALGFNLGSVYGDLDNIAKSVIYSYRRKNQI